MALFKRCRPAYIASVLTLIVSFIGSSLYIPPAYAQLTAVDPMPRMPAPGVMVHLSPEYTPAYLKGIVIHPENALKFDFIVNKGDKILTEDQKKVEYTKLTKYFLASLAIPDDDQWVNLSPYEKDRIIKDDFGKTEMGRDLLAQDYMLKQVTASLIYPEDNLGKKFWERVYTEAQKQYGTTNVPVNTFNKVWILPDDALIYEKGNTAYVLKNHLRVMLEEDYLSLQEHAGIQSVPVDNKTHNIASKIIKQIVLPALEREVNEDKNFATVRQVYSGMILAAWYKRALKESLLSRIYADKAKVKGVDQDPKTNEQIYHQYLRAYKKGVFNFIKEDVDKYTNETIPRKYFSGGGVGITQAARDLGMAVLGNKDKGQIALIETTSQPEAAQAVAEQVGNDEDDMAMVQAEEQGENHTAQQVHVSSQSTTPVVLQERLLNEPAVSEYHGQIGALEGPALKDFYDRYQMLVNGEKIRISAQILSQETRNAQSLALNVHGMEKAVRMGIIAGKTIEYNMDQEFGKGQEDFVSVVSKYTGEASSHYSVFLKHYAGVYTFVIKSGETKIIEVALGTGQKNVAENILKSDQFTNVVESAIDAWINPGHGNFEESRKTVQNLSRDESSKNAAMNTVVAAQFVNDLRNIFQSLQGQELEAFNESFKSMSGNYADLELNSKNEASKEWSLRSNLGQKLLDMLKAKGFTTDQLHAFLVVLKHIKAEMEQKAKQETDFQDVLKVALDKAKSNSEVHYNHFSPSGLGIEFFEKTKAVLSNDVILGIRLYGNYEYNAHDQEEDFSGDTDLYGNIVELSLSSDEGGIKLGFIGKIEESGSFSDFHYNFSFLNSPEFENYLNTKYVNSGEKVARNGFLHEKVNEVISELADYAKSMGFRSKHLRDFVREKYIERSPNDFLSDDILSPLNEAISELGLGDAQAPDFINRVADAMDAAMGSAMPMTHKPLDTITGIQIHPLDSDLEEGRQKLDPEQAKKIFNASFEIMQEARRIGDVHMYNFLNEILKNGIDGVIKRFRLGFYGNALGSANRIGIVTIDSNLINSAKQNNKVWMSLREVMIHEFNHIIDFRVPGSKNFTSNQLESSTIIRTAAYFKGQIREEGQRWMAFYNGNPNYQGAHHRIGAFGTRVSYIPGTSTKEYDFNETEHMYDHFDRLAASHSGIERAPADLQVMNPEIMIHKNSLSTAINEAMAVEDVKKGLKHIEEDQTKGGIDFNAANLNLQIKRDGKGVPLPISQQDLDNIHIDGLVPVLLKIIPASASPVFSQLTTAEPPQVT